MVAVVNFSAALRRMRRVCPFSKSSLRRKTEKSNEKKQELEEELGDVIYTLICFANSNKIDLDKAIRKSFNKVIKRDKNRFNNIKKNK